MTSRVFLLALLVLTSSKALASDSSPLQDFCVADSLNNVKVNGFVCKDATKVIADDFFFKGLNVPGNTANAVGSIVTPANVVQIPGLNTLGVALARIDFAPHGINPPHLHHRASEILTVIEGQLLVGFITSAPGNRLISKVLNAGDAFVFPQGLIHFQRNTGNSRVVALAGFGSQNPGVITVATNVFGSNPDIPSDILARAFQLDAKTIAQLQAKF